MLRRDEAVHMGDSIERRVFLRYYSPACAVCRLSNHLHGDWYNDPGRMRNRTVFQSTVLSLGTLTRHCERSHHAVCPYAAHDDVASSCDADLIEEDAKFPPHFVQLF